MKHMSNVRDVAEKLRKAQRLLQEAQDDLAAITGDAEDEAVELRAAPATPTEGELQAKYEALYDSFRSGDIAAISAFISGQSKRYLKAFCRANSLGLDTSKTSKEAIVESVLQWMAQRKAISG